MILLISSRAVKLASRAVSPGILRRRRTRQSTLISHSSHFFNPYSTASGISWSSSHPPIRIFNALMFIAASRKVIDGSCSRCWIRLIDRSMSSQNGRRTKNWKHIIHSRTFPAPPRVVVFSSLSSCSSTRASIIPSTWLLTA